MRLFMAALAALAAGAPTVMASPAAGQTIHCHVTPSGRSAYCRDTFGGLRQEESAAAAAASSAAGMGMAAQNAAMMAALADEPPPDPRTARPVRCGRFEAFLSSARCQAQAIAATRKEVGALVAEGKCDEALKAALTNGDFELAEDVKQFCQASASPQ